MVSAFNMGDTKATMPRDACERVRVHTHGRVCIVGMEEVVDNELTRPGQCVLLLLSVTTQLLLCICRLLECASAACVSNLWAIITISRREAIALLKR
jgi:hypothetical protein